MKTRESRDRALSKRQGKTAADIPPALVVEESCGQAALEADALLAARCVAGEVAAWEELYEQYHDPLCASIRAILRPCSDANLVDEVSARVWYALVANDGELLARYSVQKGARLVTYLRALAKHEMCRHVRSELRRRKREFRRFQETSTQDGNELARSIHDLTEFLSTLTPREREFCDEHLLSTAPSGSLSRANIWQLTHRIYQKFVRFLNRGS